MYECMNVCMCFTNIYIYNYIYISACAFFLLPAMKLLPSAPPLPNFFFAAPS